MEQAIEEIKSHIVATASMIEDCDPRRTEFIYRYCGRMQALLELLADLIKTDGSE